MSYEPFPAFSDWAIDFDPGVVDTYSERLRAAQEAAAADLPYRYLIGNIDGGD